MNVDEGRSVITSRRGNDDDRDDEFMQCRLIVSWDIISINDKTSA